MLDLEVKELLDQLLLLPTDLDAIEKLLKKKKKKGYYGNFKRFKIDTIG